MIGSFRSHLLRRDRTSAFGSIATAGLAALLAGAEPASACDGFFCVGDAIARGAHDAGYALANTGRVLEEGAYGEIRADRSPGDRPRHRPGC